MQISCENVVLYVDTWICSIKMVLISRASKFEFNSWITEIRLQTITKMHSLINFRPIRVACGVITNRNIGNTSS